MRCFTETCQTLTETIGHGKQGSLKQAWTDVNACKLECSTRVAGHIRDFCIYGSRGPSGGEGILQVRYLLLWSCALVCHSFPSKIVAPIMKPNDGSNDVSLFGKRKQSSSNMRRNISVCETTYPSIFAKTCALCRKSGRRLGIYCLRGAPAIQHGALRVYLGNVHA
jgi:hypothetical protein